MRKLFLIKIVHTTADMGSVGQELIKEGMAKLGNEKWIENQRLIENFWNELETEIDALGLDYSMIRIYQDGLPCDGEMGLRIVRKTAEKGSRNYQIIRNLVERGAAIEATESPDLLRKEYEHIKAIISAETPDEKTVVTRRYEQVKDELIQERDAYIANAIDATLGTNETGLLFIGVAHNVMPLLAKDIEVTNLD
ncbi:MAG: hypothetical protein MIO93_16765 [ANME-2 cluster archaeon]|jgi:hypothetical protein|nr:hypothetical protein [ANME-2 cluster archaeon]